MNLVAIDETSPVPPFEQLRAQLADMIRSGAVTAGTLLPTVRQLAADLDLARNTVSRSYQALERDGLVVTDRRRGTTVTGAGQPDRAVAVEAAAKRFAEELNRLGVELDVGLATLRRLRAG